MTDIQLYPAWKEAVRQIVARNLEPGTVLTKKELYGLLQVDIPENCDVDYATGQSFKLKFLDSFKKLEDELLFDHHIALKNVRGGGYMIVPPNQQARWGYAETLRELRHACKKGIARVINTNLDALNAEERKTHADYVAKMSVIRGMISRRNIEKVTAQPQIA